jgi:hypothetical protein
MTLHFFKHLPENTSLKVSEQMELHILACKCLSPAINESFAVLQWFTSVILPSLEAEIRILPCRGKQF